MVPKSKNRFGRDKNTLFYYIVQLYGDDLETSFHHITAACICLDSQPLRELLEPQYSGTDKLLARLTVCKDKK